MNYIKGCLCQAILIVVFTGPVPAVALESPIPSPDRPYAGTRKNPLSYEVDFSVVVTAPYHTKLLKVWLPLPQTDAAQAVSESRLSTYPERVEPAIGREKTFGNKFAYFEFREPKGAQIIRHRFRAKVWEVRWNLDPAKVVPAPSWPESFAPYLRRTARINRSADFQAVVREIGAAGGPSLPGVLGCMDWIEENLTYDHVNASLRADADHAFTQRRGHCSDYHGLCATMARGLGHPARVVYGIALFPKNSPSHCKMEAFMPPYGWVAFDLSETQKLIHRIESDEKLGREERERLIGAARNRLKRGFRDNTWLLVTKGTDYDLAPPAAKRVRVVRTIYAEADGEPLPDPDPANVEKREFAWMTVHKYTPDKPVAYPFKDLRSLEPFASVGGASQDEYDAVYGEGAKKLVVATGSPGELGLLKVLAEAFADENDVTVCWKKAGSGASLELLRERKVDAVMVHAPEAEKRAVEEGWAARRTLIGSNEFFVVGPTGDPAKVQTVTSAHEAYRKIAAAQATFFSRGDHSGTHKREMEVWRKAGIAPAGDWYITTGDFMTATLRRANAERGYFMTDSSTWIVQRSNLPNLKLLFRGDRLLVNVYHAMCQPEGATPGVSLAAQFVDLLASRRAQDIFRNHGKDKHGQALYNDADSAEQYE